jgi:hypothetical protein
MIKTKKAGPADQANQPYQQMKYPQPYGERSITK